MGRTGILSSVGAAVSLMMASVIALLAISSVVAFNGWPGAKASKESRNAVSIARVEVTPSPSARQRVVIGGRSSRSAGGQATRATRARRPGTGQAPAKVAGVRRNTAAPRRTTRVEKTARPVRSVAPTRGASKPEVAETPAAPANARGDVSPVTDLVEELAVGTDQLLGITGVQGTPVKDLVDALAPKTP